MIQPSSWLDKGIDTVLAERERVEMFCGSFWENLTDGCCMSFASFSPTLCPSFCVEFCWDNVTELSVWTLLISQRG